MELLESYNQISIADKLWVNRRRIAEFNHLYIPVKVVTSTTKNNKKWYWVRYLDREEVDEYLKTHTNSWKKKNKK